MGSTSSKKQLVVAGVLCGLVAVALAYFGNPANMAICVACFIRDTAGAMKMHQATLVQYVRPETIGIILGAFLISLRMREYKSTGGSSPMIRFVLGISMMIGALIFLGCPLRMILRMAGGDLNAYVGLVGFVGGVITGTIMLKKGFDLGRAYETKKISGMVLPIAAIVLFILSITTTFFAVSVDGPGSMHAPVVIALVGGLIFGVFAQRSRMCFGGSIRNVMLTKNFDLLIVIGLLFAIMLIYNLITGQFNLGFTGQPIAHTEHLWNIIGMYIVGFAAVLAGGCPLRQLVLAGQGSSDAGITVLGLFIGAAICHNFGLASSGEGTTFAGRIVGLAVIVILFAISYFGSRKEA